MNQLDLFPAPRRTTKTWCLGCGDKWGDENFMLGWCCGRNLIFDYPMNEEDLKREIRMEEAQRVVLLRASKLKW